MMVPLTKDSFVLFAARHYDSHDCLSIEDFQSDIRQIYMLARALRRYKKTGKLEERHVLNMVIGLHNVFGTALIPMLFFKITPDLWSSMKTYLVYLNYLPEGYQINEKQNESDIELDMTIIDRLRTI